MNTVNKHNDKYNRVASCKSNLNTKLRLVHVVTAVVPTLAPDIPAVVSAVPAVPSYFFLMYFKLQEYSTTFS